MISHARNGTILNVIDGISSKGIAHAFIGKSEYFESFLETNYSIDACRVDTQASFIFKSLLPVSKVERILCLDHILAHPGATVKFFIFLLAQI